MIDCNSNCSRVDAVKAMANQLKIQASPARSAETTGPSSSKLKADLLALDQQIKTGDAKKAEAALAIVRKDFMTAETTQPSRHSKSTESSEASPERLDVYA